MTLSTPARACGIDFGTSNSTVGWLRPGAPTLLPLEEGKITLPSVLFFNYEERHSVFGRLAVDSSATISASSIRVQNASSAGESETGRSTVQGRSSVQCECRQISATYHQSEGGTRARSISGGNRIEK